MVKKMKRKDEFLYVYEECGLANKEKNWAEKCKEFCSKHHSCSL